MGIIKKSLLIIGFAFLTISWWWDDSICPNNSHPHLINLGLPSGIRWSCCNVGSTSPEQTGGFYAWGETEIKSDYDEKHYKHSELSNQVPQRMGNIAGTKYDAAHIKMKGALKMPSSKQWQELIDYCSWKWTSYRGKYGRMVTGPNGKKIFIPAGGEKYGRTQWSGKDERGAYWSSDIKDRKHPYQFRFHDGMYEVRSINRFEPGFNIRPIVVK